jgi:ankyrin repeat protein
MRLHHSAESPMIDQPAEPTADSSTPIPSAPQRRRNLLKGMVFSGSIHGSVMAVILFGFPILHIVIEHEATLTSLTVVSEQQDTQKFAETGDNDIKPDDNEIRKGGAQYLADDPASQKTEKSDVPTTLSNQQDDDNPSDPAKQHADGTDNLTSETDGDQKTSKPRQSAQKEVAPQQSVQPAPSQITGNESAQPSPQQSTNAQSQSKPSQQPSNQNQPPDNGPAVILVNAQTVDNQLNKPVSEAVSEAVENAEVQKVDQNTPLRQISEKLSESAPSQLIASAAAATPRAVIGATPQNAGQTAKAPNQGDGGAPETATPAEDNSAPKETTVAQDTTPLLTPVIPSSDSPSQPQAIPSPVAPPAPAQGQGTGLIAAPPSPKADSRLAPPPAAAPQSAKSGLPPAKNPSEVVDRLAEALPRIATIRAGILAARKRPPGAMVTATDSSQSIDRLQKFAEQGYGHAQFALAEMLYTGEGMPRDPVKAKELATKAALNGYLPAQLLLGALAADGGSVDQPRDLGEAQAWLSLAAGNDSKPAVEAVKALTPMMEVKDIIKSRQRQSDLRQVTAMMSPQANGATKLTAKEAGDKLRQAAALGDLETVTVMLAQGADADSTDEDGRTALIEASWRGYSTIVSTLIQQGSNVGQTDANGKSPLMWAAINGYASVARILLDSGQNPDLQDRAGVTALMRAAWNDHPDVVRALLDKGANANLKDADNLTALDYAVKEKHPDIVPLLRNVTR